MSNFAAVSAAANNVTANGFPEFPGENPTKVQLEEWIEAHIALTPLGSGCTKNKGPFACARDISDEKL